ncbi:hypothetical protein C0J52_00251 [Blattella germanica]|nr:hypothetical protein C0J52_00251 [Blattella germanica]
MAARDLLDYIDDNDVQLGYTPNRSISSTGKKSRLSSSRKSGRFRKLYNPNDTSSADGADESNSKRRRLSLASHNATIGNASHIDSSLDVIDVTPGIDVIKSYTFQSYLLNETSLQNGKAISKVAQSVNPLCDVGNRNEFSSNLTVNRVDKRSAGTTNELTEKTKCNVNGISSLWKRMLPTNDRNCKSPLPTSSKYLSPDRCSNSSSSTLSDLAQVKSRRSLQVRRRRTLYSPNKNDDDHAIARKETIFVTPVRSNIFNNKGTEVAKQHVFQTPSKTAEPEVEDSCCNIIETPVRINSNRFNSAVELTPQEPKDQINDAEEFLRTPVNRTEELIKEAHCDMARQTDDDQNENSKKADFNDEDLPPTQPISSLLFKDVIAYVEVRSGGDNRSRGIKAHLRSFGATVVDKFINDVTHVIFNEGLLSTYKKAIKKKIPLVSVLWIEECKKAQKLVPERLYPPCDMERYESPNLFKRFRKVRSLQPDFGDEGEKVRRRRKKTMPELETEVEIPELPFYKRRIKVPGFLESASNQNGMVRTLLSVADIGPEDEEIVNRPVSPTLSEEEDLVNPPTLAVRLLRKMLTPKSSPDVNSVQEARDELQQTPKSQNMVNSEEPTVRKLFPKEMRNNFVNNVENYESLKGSNGINSFRSDNINENTSNSPVFQRSENPKLHKLPSSVMELNEQTRREKTADVIPSTSGVNASTEKNSSKDNAVKKVQKAVKRRYSTLADIAAKISANKCQSPDASTIYSKINERAISKNKKQSKLLEPRREDGNDSKEKSSKKRKLMTLRRTETPEELDISTIEEEGQVAASQCPYSPEERPRKRKKAIGHEGNSVPMDLTDCVTSTTNGMRKIKKARKKFNVSSKNELELVSKAGHSSRGSSGEFVVTMRTFDDERPQKAPEKKMSSLVCTGLQRHEVEVVSSVVKNLGGFVMEAKVSANTSHIVTPGPKRTLNLLKGIARGCWVVLQEWVLRSLESGKWLEEEPFELQDFSPAVQQSRIQKLSFGRFYKQDLFSDCGPIFVSNKSVPPKQELVELIKLCGGHVVSACRSAKLLVGRGCISRYAKLKTISEKWILDSVQFCELRNAEDYEV